MKLILTQDVAELGDKGDVVDVADGYGRNYLVPRSLAVKATTGALRQADAMRVAREEAIRAARMEAEAYAQSLTGTRVVVAARSGDEGKLFGSIGEGDIAAAITKFTGINVDRKIVHIEGPIKEIGLQIKNPNNTTATTIKRGPEIKLLKNVEYYNTLLEDIRRANKSILVAMYVIKYDPFDFDDPVNRLLEELVRARERGVDVRVLIEFKTRGEELYENLEAYEFLKNHNISVKLDRDPSTTIHTKLVIIDDRIVYLGSHNWSEESLQHNDEVSVRIVSEDNARSLEEYFQVLWSR